MKPWLGLLSLLLVAGLSSIACGQDAAEIAIHEKTLKDAKLAVDGPALLGVFKSRTLSDDDRAKLAEMVKLLGDRSFKVRDKASQDLAKAGRSALPLLERAKQSSDPEVARRAERAIDEIQNQTNEAPLLLSAAALLTVRKPEGSVETLLAYLPCANEELVVEYVHQTLSKVGVNNGKPVAAVAKALADREPSRRVAAAYVIGTLDAAQHKDLKPLLKDADAAVRFQAANGLVRGGDREGVAPLIELLADTPLTLASQAEDLLYRLAGEKAPQVGLYGDNEARAKCVKAWGDWWQANSKTIELKKIGQEEAALGYTLICEAHLPNGGGRIFERGRDGKNRWEITVTNPIDVEYLRGNRLLIANCNSNEVIETDLKGKVLWKHPVNSPVSVQRLSNGNTFIGTYSGVLEVTSDGKEVYKHTRNKDGSLYYAQRQKNGNIFCVHSNGRVVEIDATGKELWSNNVGNTGIWGDVQLLPNGRILVAKSSANEVVEIDREGKVVWKGTVKQPLAAVRLPNGNTLATSYSDHTVVELDRDGKEISKIQLQGLPFRARRR